MTELYHHGIKGMKWGVRRYQNADGSLTPAGKKRQEKQFKKEEKKYDKAYRKNYYKAYNQAADYANKVLIPKINKKYEKYDFSNMDDPKVKRIYDKYINEYQTMFKDTFNTKMKDLIGDRPERK